MITEGYHISYMQRFTMKWENKIVLSVWCLQRQQHACGYFVAACRWLYMI